MKERNFFLFFVAAIFFLSESVVIAQPIPLGGEFQIHTTTAGDQGEPKGVYDSQGNFMIVWFSAAAQDGSGHTIMGRRYDPMGNPLTGELIVNTTSAGIQFLPDIAIDGHGRVIVVWTSAHAGAPRIMGQRFDSSGAPLGGEFPISTENSTRQSFARVAANREGYFICVWQSDSGRNLRGRVYDPAGQPMTGEFPINSFTSGSQYSARVDIDEDGTILVAWTDSVQDGSSEGVFARRFTMAGVPIDTVDFRLSTRTVGSQMIPDIAFDPNGGFIAVWTEQNFPGGQGLDIIGRRFDDNRIPVADEFRVNEVAESLQLAPRVVFDADGNFVVTWEDGIEDLLAGLDGSGAGAVLRRFRADGTPTGASVVANTFRVGEQSSPHLAAAPNGDMLVTWQSWSQDGSRYGVYGQRFEPTRRIDPALAGHWPLDEGMGTVAANSAGNGLDGVLEQGAGWTAGQQGSAVWFDGIDDLIRVADSGSTQLDVTDTLTLALWVRPDDLDGSAQVLVSKDNAYELELGKLGRRSWDLRLNNQTVRVAATSLEEGVWQHLAMTWDGSEVCSYFNGLLDGCSPFATPMIPNDNDLGLGARPSGVLEGGPVFHFAGALDEVYVFNRAFDEDEIAALVLAELDDLEPPVRSDLQPALSLLPGSTSATLSLDTDENAECRWDVSAGQRFDAMANVFTITGGTGHSSVVPVSDGTFRYYVRCRDEVGNTNGEDATIVFGVGASDLCGDLISHWDLEEGSGCAAADAFGPNPGDLGPDCPTSAPEWVAGRAGLGGALAFDGGTDQVEVLAPGGFTSLSGVTVAAWIRHAPAFFFRSIVDHRERDDDGYDLFLTGDSQLFLRVNDLTLVGDTVVADGQWHHVVGTYDGSELRLYVDGVLDKAQPASSTTIDVTGSLFLGRRWNNDQTPLAGELGEVTVLGRGLSAVEVLDLYGGGLDACIP